MEYRKQISSYIEKRRQEVRTESTLKAYERYVNGIAEFAEKYSCEVSDDELIKAYSDSLKKHGYNDSTLTKKIIPECKKFITWCLSQQGDDNVTDTNIEVKEEQQEKSESDNATAIEVEDIQQQQEASVRVTKGRKLKGKEARTQKVSLYMPPKLYEQINDLAHFDRKSVGDILIELTEGYVKDNARKLEIFRRAIQEAQESE